MKITVVFLIAATFITAKLSADNTKTFYADGPSTKKILALSFDDGPGPHSEEVLAILEKYAVKATFFVVGQTAEKRPDKVKKIFLEGHEIGNHTWSHRNYYTEVIQEKEKVLRLEIEKTDSEILSIIGFKPRLLRLPNGYCKKWAREVSSGTGHILVNWSFGADWHKMSSSELADKYISSIVPGAILLMHDGGRNKEMLLAALPKILEAIKAQGYEIVPVGKLLELEVYDGVVNNAEGEN